MNDCAMNKFSKSLNPRNIDKSFSDIRIRIRLCVSLQKESVSLQKKSSDNTNMLGERNLEKKIVAKNIVSLATQLSQNQNKTFPGKVVVYIFILESFVLPSVYKSFLQIKTQTLSIKTKSHLKYSPTQRVIVNNILSLATQLSQNQNKIFPGKVIVYIFIPESFVLPSVYKNFHRSKRKRYQLMRNHISNILQRNELS